MRRFDQDAFEDFLLEKNCVSWGNPESPKPLASGRPGYYYINMRDLFSTWDAVERTVDFAWAFIRDNVMEHKPEQIIGVPEGATQWGWELNKLLGDRGYSYAQPIVMRKKPKTHGLPKDRYFIGNLAARVLLVEDTTTTGDSLIERIEYVREAGTKVVAAMSFANRLEKIKDGEDSVADFLQKRHNIPFYSMTTSGSLLPRFASKSGIPPLVAQKIAEYPYAATKVDLTEYAKA